MKLKVQHPDGRIEVITLVPPATARLGTTLNVITDARGMDHYFDLDGFYDGWGCGCSIPMQQGQEDLTLGRVGDFIQSIEGVREIEPRS